METQLPIYGSRKGKQNSFRQMLSSIAGKSLQLFPVPGLDVFLAKGMNPHQKGVTIASTPRHANVLLVTSPLPENLVQYVANVYAQMPRPRLLVAVATEINDPLPPPDVVLTDEDLNQIYQKVSFAHTWIEEALPYELPTLEREGEAIYTCPMHPEVKSDKPGNCPICGMRLVKQEGEKQPNDSLAEQNEKHRHNAEPKNEMEPHSSQPNNTGNQDKVTYTCPMHPEVVSNQPGNCPICGMNLVKAEPPKQLKDNLLSQGKEHAHHEHIQQDSDDKNKTTYNCPMHPEVQSDQPGSCPKCGMALVKQEPSGKQMDMSNESKLEHSGQNHEMDMQMHQHEEKSEHQNTKDEDINENGKSIYTCPMHPEVQSEAPGSCPKCGMTLVKKELEENSTQHSVKQEDKHNAHMHKAHEGKTVYTCSMHPEVQSDKPGNCPICGMNLVKQEDSKQHIEMSDEHAGHQMKGHDMKADNMDSMSGGFMSMVQMTKDMPRSEDGLAMEMNDASFGPFHPGLPGGLLLKMKLDGDTVMKATVEKGTVSRNLLHHFPKEPAQLSGYLSQLNPLLHHTYTILVHKAINNAAGNEVFDNEVTFLEKDRISSHLNWLGLFGKTIGDRELHYRASQLCFAWQSGKADKTAIQKLIRSIEKTPYIKRRLSKINMIPEDKLPSLIRKRILNLWFYRRIMPGVVC
jgi:hypothetical protein